MCSLPSTNGPSVISTSPSCARTTVAVLGGCSPPVKTHAPAALISAFSASTSRMIWSRTLGRGRVAVGLVDAEQVLFHRLFPCAIVAASVTPQFTPYTNGTTARSTATVIKLSDDRRRSSVLGSCQTAIKGRRTFIKAARRERAFADGEVNDARWVPCEHPRLAARCCRLPAATAFRPMTELFGIAPASFRAAYARDRDPNHQGPGDGQGPPARPRARGGVWPSMRPRSRACAGRDLRGPGAKIDAAMIHWSARLRGAGWVQRRRFTTFDMAAHARARFAWSVDFDDLVLVAKDARSSQILALFALPRHRGRAARGVGAVRGRSRGERRGGARRADRDPVSLARPAAPRARAARLRLLPGRSA